MLLGQVMTLNGENDMKKKVFMVELICRIELNTKAEFNV
jgi:hypothetical protein